ncbi:MULTISPECIES: LLM class flavin-dependent oxidoreductase [unclassified Streptomyces]|uniref:LLM class flavin-dependent oxidoreductase n=1 Tax=unclassified Streptomyces TaxID=2593676 RepID=UPI002E2A65DB|nr:LLM class flavin-dependent oxidoreductase [Streptomyces sp. NBC_00223]
MTAHLAFGGFMSPLHPPGEDPTFLFERDLRLVQLMDELGYAECWVGEHHSGGWATIGSPEIFIAAAAERTKHIRLGSGVTALPYHHPFMVAERAVQLDHMTRGRFMLGAGAGSLVSDMYMFGISPEETRARAAQSLETVLALLDGAEPVTRIENWFQLHEARLQLQPRTRPRMEVATSSAFSPLGMRLAGRLGVGPMSLAAPPFGAARPGIAQGAASLAAQWQHAEEAAAEAGRTADRSTWRIVLPVHVAETREEAFAQFAPGWTMFRRKYYSATLGVPVATSDVGARKSLEATVESLGAIVGSVDDCVAAIEHLRDVTGGFGKLLITLHDCASRHDEERSLELFARYVAPRFNGSLDSVTGSNTWVGENKSRFQNAHFAALKQAEAGLAGGGQVRTRGVGLGETQGAAPSAPATT